MAILQSLDHGVNSLDGLFILPYQRCRYYKKLYTKLLKSTHPGRSDHRLLSAANDKLDELIMHCETAFQNHVADLEQEVEPSEQPRDSPPEEEEITFSAPPPPKLPPLPNERLPQPPSIPDRSEMPSHADKPMPTPPRSPVKFDTFQSESSRISNSSWAASRDSSNSGSMQASDSQRSSSAQNTQQTSATSLSASVQDMNINSALSTDELEARLNTSRTLDIFSLMPKKCRLQINPPGLSFKRGIRFSGDVAMSFRLSENSVRQRKARYPPEEESQHPLDIQTSRACIFLLTDLFLLCEHNLKTDTLSLLFPPLAGKHLRATTVDADPEGREFEIIIMHKEAVGVRCGSRDERDRWLAHINDCIAFQPPRESNLWFVLGHSDTPKQSH